MNNLPTIALEQIEDWLTSDLEEAIQIEALAPDISQGIPTEESVPLFLWGVATLAHWWGVPDWPAPDTFDWGQALGLNGPLAMVWDFDYYQVSIRHDDDTKVVVLAKHSGNAEQRSDRSVNLVFSVVEM